MSIYALYGHLLHENEGKAVSLSFSKCKSRKKQEVFIQMSIQYAIQVFLLTFSNMFRPERNSSMNYLPDSLQ